MPCYCPIKLVESNLVLIPLYVIADICFCVAMKLKSRREWPHPQTKNCVSILRF